MIETQIIRAYLVLDNKQFMHDKGGGQGGVNFGTNYCEPLMNGSLNRKILHFGSAETNTISVKT